MTIDRRAILALVFTIVVWGVIPAFVRSFSLKTGPADAIVIRMCCTALGALPLFLLRGWHLEKSDFLKLLLLATIGMFGYFLGSIFGFSYVPTGFGSMIIGVQPLFIAVLAAVIGREQLTKFGILGLAISFAGTVYLFGGNAGGTTGWDDLLRGGVLLLLSDMAWAIYVVFSKPLIAKYGTFKISTWTLVLCAPPSLLFISASTWPSVIALDGQAWLVLFFLSIIGTVICLLTWNYAVPKLSATTMGASLYLIPVLAVASGWFVLNEQITGATLLAGFIIMAGVAVAEFGNSWRRVRA